MQVIGRMLSATTAMIHWDEPEEPNGQVVGYRVYYTSDSTLPVNQVCGCLCLPPSIVSIISFSDIVKATSKKEHAYVALIRAVGEADGPRHKFHHYPRSDS